MLVEQFMSSPAYTVKATATVENAAELMALHDVGALPVTLDGELVGIVTVDDLLEILAEELTELARIVAREQSRESAARK